MPSCLLFCCGARCPRWWPTVPASASHAAAEKRFAFLLQQGGGERHDNFCTFVQELDDEVQAGHVRRVVAAVLASSLHPWTAVSQNSTCTLLYALIRSPDHAVVECSCMARVLSWGTCPTVPMASLCLESSFTTCGLLPTSSRKHWWYKDLLAYGSAPWGRYRVHNRAQTNKLGQCAMLCFDPYRPSDQMQVAQKQWWRWHARCSRRLWLRAHGSRLSA
jgi:hypothetical protein